ncbi:MAG: LysM domain-containing protein [Acidimicrobiales bacterium]
MAGTEVTAPSTTAPAPTTVPPPPTTVQVNYVVQSGDSLSVIASRFGVSTQALADFNAISDVNSIVVGQELSIPPTTVATSSTTVAG